MRRAFPYLLISAGLAFVGFGVYSVWSARYGEKQAEEQWIGSRDEHDDEHRGANQRGRAEIDLQHDKKPSQFAESVRETLSPASLSNDWTATGLWLKARTKEN